MKPTRRFLLWLLLLATLWAFAVQAAHVYSPRIPSFDEVEELALSLDWPPAMHRDLIEVHEITLECVEGSAAVVRLRDRVPAREALVIKIDHQWKPILIDKELSSGWRASIDVFLSQQERCDDEHLLSSDLVKILVDPSPHYGRLIDGSGSIPGLRRRERSKYGCFRISSFRRPGGIGGVSFFTWNYFGGEIVAWSLSVDTSHRVLVSRVVVDREVGDFSFYH